MSTLEKSLGEFPESLEERVKLLADVSVSGIEQRYKMQQVLGSGAQATVYQAVAKKTQRKAAVKVLDQKELEDDDLFDALRMEIMILKQLKHPCVRCGTRTLAMRQLPPRAPRLPTRTVTLAPGACVCSQIHCQSYRDRARH